MPRKGHIRKRTVIADPVFGIQTLTKFVNCVMYCGKKSTAERIVYGALELSAKRLNSQPDEVFRKAMDNVKPVVEVKPRRVGGATYQVPVEVGPERAEALAILWIIQYARAKKGMPMVERLAREFSDAFKGEGASMKKREDTHKMAEANRAFAHYRW